MIYLIQRKPTLKQQILKLCEQTNYFVRVSNLSTESTIKIITLFPNRCFGHPTFENEELIHEVDGSKVRRYDKEKWRTFNLPTYIIRPFIIQDIYLKCGFLGIDYNLVFAYNENNEKCKLIDCIPEPKDLNKEYEKQAMTVYGPYGTGTIEKLKNFKDMEPGIKFLNNFLLKSVDKFIDEEIFV